MTRSARIVLAIIGTAVAAFGLIAGLVPVHSGSYTCGNAFHESSQLEVQQLTDTMEGGDGSNDCDGARSSRSVFAWGGLGAGAVLLLAAGVVPYDKREVSPEPARRSTSAE